jgi:hypothetical protein
MTCKTGRAEVTYPPTLDTYWFHHRCYRAKATEQYVLCSRTGIEFVDLATGDWTIHHWVRGGCLYGIMPANGLIYAPPHPCACYPEAKLYGMVALAALRQLGRCPSVCQPMTVWSEDQPMPRCKVTSRAELRPSRGKQTADVKLPKPTLADLPRRSGPQRSYGRAMPSG